MVTMSFLSATTEKARPCDKGNLSRRGFVIGTAAIALAGCQTTGSPQHKRVADLRQDQYYKAIYGPKPEEKFPIPAVNLRRVPNGKYLRQEVNYTGPEDVGTVVIDPSKHFLYLVRGDGTAMRYGVGVGRAGFRWNGDAVIQYKRKWPKWTPPAEMIARQPELEEYRYGMAPGINNPLGARALYLFQNGKDTLYRLHGTNEHWSIGTNVSSGCIRLLHHDVIDVYNRVPNGSRVVVRPASDPWNPLSV